MDGDVCAPQPIRSFSSIPLDFERSSRQLPNVRRWAISELLTAARPRRRRIIFDQDAETPLCAGGVSQESRWRIRGEPPPPAASRPSALAGTPEHPASASSTRHREFSIAGSGADLRRRGTVRSHLGRCRNVRPSNPYGLHPCAGRGRPHERTAQQAEYRSAGVRGRVALHSASDDRKNERRAARTDGLSDGPPTLVSLFG